MKKKIKFWETVGVFVALATWRATAADLPINPLITPPEVPMDPGLQVPGPNTACPPNMYRKLIGGQWRCWPDPPPAPPDCGQFETPKWDADKRVWRCVPKGLL